MGEVRHTSCSLVSAAVSSFSLYLLSLLSSVVLDFPRVVARRCTPRALLLSPCSRSRLLSPPRRRPAACCSPRPSQCPSPRCSKSKPSSGRQCYQRASLALARRLQPRRPPPHRPPHLALMASSPATALWTSMPSTRLLSRHDLTLPTVRTMAHRRLVPPSSSAGQSSTTPRKP